MRCARTFGYGSTALPLASAGERLTLASRIAFVFLWLFIFSVPWEDTIVIPGFGTVTRLIGVIALLFGFLGVLERNYLKPVSTAFCGCLLFATWAAWTATWTVSPELTGARIQTCLQLLCVAFLVSQFGQGPQKVASMLNAYLLGTCVSSFYTVGQFVLRRETMYQRYAAAGFDPNDLGIILAISLPFSFQLAMATRGLLSNAYRFHFALTLTAILLTASRAASAATLVALLIVPWTLRRATSAVRLKTAASALGVLVVVLLFVPSTTWQRLGTLVSEATEGSVGSRREIWAAGLEVFRAQPLIGIGAGAFPESVVPVLGVPNFGRYVAHNTYLSVLVESGLVGLLLFAIIVGSVAHHVYRLRNTRRAAWTCAFLALALGIGTVTWEHRKPLWLFVTICSVDGPLVAAVAIRRNHRIAQHSPATSLPA